MTQHISTILGDPDPYKRPNEPVRNYVPIRYDPGVFDATVNDEVHAMHRGAQLVCERSAPMQEKEKPFIRRNERLYKWLPIASGANFSMRDNGEA